MATRNDPMADPREGIGFNMTPMIDVVFQLIIFLMLANDMSRREIEDLELPVAVNAREDTGLEPRRVLVNLLAGQGPGEPPRLKVRGTEMDLEEFKRSLGPEAARERDADGASALYVLLRADRRTRWQDVQWVMQACADPALRIRRVQFATTPPSPGGN